MTGTPHRVLVLGATGTIGRATTSALAQAGHRVHAVSRRADPDLPATIHIGAVTDASYLRSLMAQRDFDVVICCLASRGGGPRDAWAIDHRATVNAIEAARTAGVGQFILLSAICVQKPRLAFQHAKLAAEQALVASGLAYTIVRPTAFFKSLSGQLARVQAGKPYLMFGDGTLTACKPISDRDLGRFITGCIGDPKAQNRILPIGGPGAAITPRAQADHLSQLLGRKVPTRSVPVAMFDLAAGVLGALGRIVPPLADKAEFARIAKYYATESMLVWDADAARYDAAATPSFGQDHLFDYYTQVLAGEAQVERGAHSLFRDSD